MLEFLQKIGRRLKRMCCASVSDPVCYRANQDGIFYLSGSDVLSDQISALPTDLFILPGKYRWHGKIYDVSQEGLYRFVLPEKENHQKIMYQNNVSALLSTIAWMASHGNRDDKKSYATLLQIARRDKLLLTCEPLAQFAHALLKQHQVMSRVVYAEERVFSNCHDNGHVMLEVFLDQKWILYDLDMGVFFTHNNQPLSFSEFISSVPTGAYDIVRLAQKNILAVGQFRSRFGFHYHFLMEGVLVNLKAWYKKTCQVVRHGSRKR